MTKILDLIEYYLEERGHNPCRIDGHVKQEVRQEQVGREELCDELSFGFATWKPLSGGLLQSFF
jgi:hypothetical protein